MFWIRAGLIVAGLFSTQLPANAPAEAPASSEEVDVKKVSQAFGHFIGKNLKMSGLQIDVDSFVEGIQGAYAGKAAPLSDEEYEKQMMLLQERTFKKLAEDNLSTAEAFLKKNSQEKGVIELEPGKLQIFVIKEGSGAAVEDTSTPQINYTGTYADGSVFSSSKEAGNPITIPLDQTIPGFAKGLKGMKEGEIRKIFVHPDLGYGKGGQLPPNSLLIFEVELVKADAPLAARPDLLEIDEEDEGDEDEEKDKKKIGE